jgi:hypothetical protein
MVKGTNSLYDPALVKFWSDRNITYGDSNLTERTLLKSQKGIF